MPQDISRYKSDTKATISVGSNVALGMTGPAELALAGIAALDGDETRVVAASRLFATPCVPAGAGPDYINAVVSVSTTLGAGELLSFLHQIEGRFERRREKRWGARTLDLDLLDFGGVVLPDPDVWQSWHDLPFDRQTQAAPDRLILPHPRIQDRAFVLIPLCDIAPEWRHPVLDMSAQQMCRDLTEADRSGIVPLESAESLALFAKGR
ncbi:2-amino-4-hydroxy-6-hydroxymethyldihydropteridine diphosphokinase [Tropicimonas marinistellae]|uniref:2-amino-4-hydroxy-6- hydroxymethyldihydropteridine diphosphokinase n=1 Tax=Tropicimonas marinistellae TaxID=1739787 RepID=UPI000A5BA05A|nr:2-amino-4-hydroxy-6-hydroxymethyldihydropteridine diphosphokinase [Tropicimonas marinistellae]